MRIREMEKRNPPARYVVTSVAASSREKMIQFLELGIRAGKIFLYGISRIPSHRVEAWA